MSHLLSLLGIEAWKPVLMALVLPPVPLLLLILVGAGFIRPRRGLGWLLVLLGATGIWLSACAGVGAMLTRSLLHPPPALSSAQIAQLRSQAKTRQAPTIVVLGGGRDALAPEYGMSNLAAVSLERLRYGLWLGRETGAPVGFTGGVGWSGGDGPPEAEVAERVAAKDLGLPLKWVEAESRDTRENALLTVAMLKRAGVTRVVLVTNGWHMPRAMRLFESAAAGQIEIVAAPMDLATITNGRILDWLPSSKGFERVRQVLHEWFAKLAGD